MKRNMVSGVIITLFLVSMLSMSFNSTTVQAASPVTYFWEDTTTKGNWYPTAIGSPIGVYGTYAYILPYAPRLRMQVPIGNFSVPIGGYSGLPDPPYNWTSNQISGLPFYLPNPPYYDEYVSKTPPVTYYINGTRYYYSPPEGYVQYPAFEWRWTDQHDPPQGSDPREVYYPVANKWRFACWDDGGERSQPTHGYINFTLTFPQGTYLLSLYAYDYEKATSNGKRESQVYRIYDATGTTLLAGPVRISGKIFDEGVYEVFIVVAPAGGRTIIVQVYNDAGHYGSEGESYGHTLNVILSGIFVDKIKTCVCGLTIGFWKTNAAKDLGLITGRPQVPKDPYLSLLGCVGSKYGVSIDDWSAWKITANTAGLKWALHWLSYGAYVPSVGWTNGDASNPIVKARAQLLALMLTACYKGANYLDAWIYVPGVPGHAQPMTISDWISYIIGQYNADHYKDVYYIANYLNNHCAMLPIDP